MFHTYVFLTKTDTTVGLLSQDPEALTRIKKRPPHKHYIHAVDSLRTLRSKGRVPLLHRQRLRRAKRTTFILPSGHSYRVIDDKRHLLLLSRLKWVYTTSANLSGYAYNESFSREHADVIIEPLGGESTPSKIYKLGRIAIKRIR